MGYCGGTTENPTYEKIGDYIETIQLDYDPAAITYQELLKIFFISHSPDFDMRVRQYVSAIFYHNENQKLAALEAKELEQHRRGTKLYTLIMPYEKLYLAEAYHQKYYMQLVDIIKGDMRRHYPAFREFIDSTAAARINGYLKGLGSIDELMTEIDLLGLSEKSRKRLIEIVDSYS